MTFAAVSKHIKVLEQAGLVSRGREAQWRPCRLEAGPLRDVTEWLEDLPAVLGRERRPARGLPPAAAGAGQAEAPKTTTREERPMTAIDTAPPASPRRRTSRSSCSTGWSTRRARRSSRMYADPAHLVHFWGPHGSSTSISSFDFRVGGAWRMVIRFPGRLRRADEQRLRGDRPAAPHRLPRLRRRASGCRRTGCGWRSTSATKDGRTRLTVTVRFDSLADRDEAVAHGFTGPITDSFDRLEALLAG